jgi:hypothetical protein
MNRITAFLVPLLLAMLVPIALANAAPSPDPSPDVHTKRVVVYLGHISADGAGWDQQNFDKLPALPYATAAERKVDVEIVNTVGTKLHTTVSPRSPEVGRLLPNSHVRLLRVHQSYGFVRVRDHDAAVYVCTQFADGGGPTPYGKAVIECLSKHFGEAK